MTNKPISEVIAEIKAVAEEATETQWIVADEDWSDGDDAIVTCELRQGMIEIAKIQGGGSESGYDDEFADQQRANAAFIALMCPENALRLIDHIAALEQQLAAERARVVKLPRKDAPIGSNSIVIAASNMVNAMRNECAKAIHAAGIPVEGE